MRNGCAIGKAMAQVSSVVMAPVARAGPLPAAVRIRLRSAATDAPAPAP